MNEDQGRALQAARGALTSLRGQPPEEVAGLVRASGRGAEPPRGAGRRLWPVVGGFAAILSVFALLILVLQHSSSGVAEAVEILRDVEAVAISPTASGVNSFSMTTVTPVLGGVDVGGTMMPNRTGQQVQSAVWFESPNRKRVEATVYDGNGEAIWRNLIVWDGVAVWFDSTEVRSGTRSVRVLAQQTVEAKSGGIAPDTGSMNAFLASVTQCYNHPEILRDEVVAGRKAVVLNLGPSSCAATVDKDPLGYGGVGDRFIRVDTETAFVLRDELRDESGVAVVGTSRTVTSVVFNTYIQAGQFVYEPPSGVEVVDCRTNVCD